MKTMYGAALKVHVNEVSQNKLMQTMVPRPRILTVFTLSKYWLLLLFSFKKIRFRDIVYVYHSGFLLR